MKNQKKDLKLFLSKKTISKLNSMSSIKGGRNTASQNCGTSVEGKGCQADNTNYCDH